MKKFYEPPHKDKLLHDCEEIINAILLGLGVKKAAKTDIKTFRFSRKHKKVINS